MPTTTKKKAVKEPRCTVVVTINGKSYTGKGNTVLEALRSIPKPAKIMAKGTVKVSDGDKSNEIQLTTVRMKRLFYPIAQPFLAKVFSYNLK